MRLRVTDELCSFQFNGVARLVLAGHGRGLIVWEAFWLT